MNKNLDLDFNFNEWLQRSSSALEKLEGIEDEREKAKELLRFIKSEVKASKSDEHCLFMPVYIYLAEEFNIHLGVKVSGRTRTSFRLSIVFYKSMEYTDWVIRYPVERTDIEAAMASTKSIYGCLREFADESGPNALSFVTPFKSLLAGYRELVAGQGKL